jgi:hypothetical protein
MNQLGSRTMRGVLCVLSATLGIACGVPRRSEETHIQMWHEAEHQSMLELPVVK